MEIKVDHSLVTRSRLIKYLQIYSYSSISATQMQANYKCSLYKIFNGTYDVCMKSRAFLIKSWIGIYYIDSESKDCLEHLSFDLTYDHNYTRCILYYIYIYIRYFLRRYFDKTVSCSSIYQWFKPCPLLFQKAGGRLHCTCHNSGTEGAVGGSGEIRNSFMPNLP